MSEEQLNLMGDETPPDIPADQISSDEPKMSAAEEKARAHGWTDLDTFVENGGDAANWKGYNAWTEWYEKTQEHTAEVKGLKNDIQTLTNNFSQLTERERAKHKSQLEDALAKAKEEMDVESAVKISNELQQIEQVETPAPAGEHPVVTSFRAKNPALDLSSANFKTEVDVLTTYHFNQNPEIVSELSNNRTPSDVTINRALDDAFKKAKAALPHLFEEKIPSPPTIKSPSKKNATAKPFDQLDKEAQEIYNIISDTQSQAAADNFAKRFIGDQ